MERESHRVSGLHALGKLKKSFLRDRIECPSASMDAHQLSYSCNTHMTIDDYETIPWRNEKFREVVRSAQNLYNLTIDEIIRTYCW